MKKVFALFKDEEGATSIEYAIMAAAIAAVIVASAVIIGSHTNDNFKSALDAMPAAP